MLPPLPTQKILPSPKVCATLLNAQPLLNALPPWSQSASQIAFALSNHALAQVKSTLPNALPTDNSAKVECAQYALTQDRLNARPPTRTVTTLLEHAPTSFVTPLLLPTQIQLVSPQHPCVLPMVLLAPLLEIANSALLPAASLAEQDTAVTML